MRNPAQSRIDNVTVMSLGTALGIYTLVAVAGFMTYGDAVESNILISYPSKHMGMYVCYMYSHWLAYRTCTRIAITMTNSIHV